jgi:hypothetical protein
MLGWHTCQRATKEGRNFGRSGAGGAKAGMNSPRCEGPRGNPGKARREKALTAAEKAQTFVQIEADCFLEKLVRLPHP